MLADGAGPLRPTALCTVYRCSHCSAPYAHRALTHTQLSEHRRENQHEHLLTADRGIRVHNLQGSKSVA
ncbi:hypothetical protein B0H17DRAFT_1063609 [Mycena rosella]|uniref:Uncharacterized protein n=1 Tax=Mycena rosella TaxID=1033263 RepID=A0AAD7DIP0_MYCRO|nr:hypothetical protein B0H17DRAFT_1063609 [Mycena rosella]